MKLNQVKKIMIPNKGQNRPQIGKGLPGQMTREQHMQQMEWDIIKNELPFLRAKEEWYALSYNIRRLDKKLVPWYTRFKMWAAKQKAIRQMKKVKKNADQ